MIVRSTLVNNNNNNNRNLRAAKAFLILSLFRKSAPVGKVGVYDSQRLTREGVSLDE